MLHNITLFGVFISLAFMHPFHVSVTEMDYNELRAVVLSPNERSSEVSIRFGTCITKTRDICSKALC